jgi:hypothetical protein
VRVAQLCLFKCVLSSVQAVCVRVQDDTQRKMDKCTIVRRRLADARNHGTGAFGRRTPARFRCFNTCIDHNRISILLVATFWRLTLTTFEMQCVSLTLILLLVAPINPIGRLLFVVYCD